MKYEYIKAFIKKTIMAWGNLAQTDSSDAVIHYHETLEELGRINELLDLTLIEAKLSK